MSTTSPKSPHWKRPSDIMKRHQRRKTPATSNKLTQAPLKPQNGQLCSQELRVSPGRRKRKNPFGFGSCPRRKASVRLSMQRDAAEAEDTTMGRASTPSVLDSILQARKEAQPKATAGVDTCSESSQLVEESGHHTGKEMTSASGMARPKPSLDVISPHALLEQPQDWPTDWSLKTKARFVSPTSFSWCHPLKSQEEARGLSRFVRCQVADDSEPVVSKAEAGDVKGACSHSEVRKCQLQSCCNVWQHPHISWLKLFPRMTADNKIGRGPSLAQNEDIQDALMADWTESLSSVFNLTRARQCPYFYLCAHQFTAVFHAAGVRGKEQMHALLGPTSRGLREAMKAEGIEYTLPLYHRTSGESAAPPQSLSAADSSSGDAASRADAAPISVTTGQDTAAACDGDVDMDDDNDEIRQTDDGAASWLHDLGLDTARYRSLDPSKVKLHREVFREIDHRAESTVLVEGPDTLALYNFLLNCRSCVANTGIQQGIPPTLLAPVAFRGATLQTLKVKTGSVQQQTEKGLERWFSLEVWGPLLPSTLHCLSSLFRETQGSYAANFSVHESTAPLNVTQQTAREPSAEQTEGLKNCGLSQKHIEALVGNNLGGRRAIRELTCTEGHYAWVT